MFQVVSSGYTFASDILHIFRRAKKSMKNSMYEETYGSGAIHHYEKPRRHHTRRIVTVVVLISIIILLLVGGLGVAVRVLNPTPVRTTTETRTFNVGAGKQPTLIVSNDSGFVHVRSGSGNTITVTTTKVGDSFGASPDDFKLNYTQSGDTITVHVTNDSIHPFDFSQTSQADLNVTVPANSNLQLATNSGDIAASGIQGKLILTSNSGSLQATGDSLTSGSRMVTDSGSITMSGSIDTTGIYAFQASSGDVAVTLPRSTNFHANLASNSGSITNDFPIVNTHKSGDDGRTVIGDIGSSPQATVFMQSDSGSLHLRQL